MRRDIFNLIQFFVDGTHEFVRRNATPPDVVQAAEHYINSVAAKMGVVQRVIITDDEDRVCFEWEFGEGIIFPPTMADC